MIGCSKRKRIEYTQRGWQRVKTYTLLCTALSRFTCIGIGKLPDWVLFDHLVNTHTSVDQKISFAPSDEVDVGEVPRGGKVFLLNPPHPCCHLLVSIQGVLFRPRARVSCPLQVFPALLSDFEAPQYTHSPTYSPAHQHLTLCTESKVLSWTVLEQQV